MLRVYQDIFPNIMTEVLLLSQTLIRSTRPVKSVYYDTESLGYLVPKIWKLIPPQLKKVESLLSLFVFPVISSVETSDMILKVAKYRIILALGKMK